jgi:uncharacterized FAD-dependent dehydrogenase
MGAFGWAAIAEYKVRKRTRVVRSFCMTDNGL